MKLFSLDSPIMRFLEKLGNIMIINACFIVYCLPVVTIGASASAMYRCFLTMLKDEDSGLLKLFWISFKTNFKKATLLEICVLPVLALVTFEVMVLLSGVMGNGTGQAILFALPFILVCCVISYIFPLQAQFENSIFRTIKNAALLALSHFPITIVITALNLIFPLMMYFLPELFAKSMIAWLLFGFGGIAYLNTCLLRRVFEQYFPKENSTEIEQ